MLYSCTKQEAPSVHPDIPRSAEELQRIQSCGSVNFIKNFFTHQNVRDLFKCLGWNKSFTAMFNSVESVDEGNWNHLFTPTGREFFDNRVRRDRIFKYVKTLDAKSGLDDLGRVVTALNETNFYDSLDVLFKCADMPSLEVCKNRKPHLMKKNEIKNLFKFMLIDSDLYGHAANSLRSTVGAIGDQSNELRNEINKFYKTTEFTKLRLSLMTRLLNTVNRGISNEERAFMAKIFFTVTKEDGKPWLHRWFTNDKLSDENFNRLFSYPVSVNPDFIKDALALKNAFKQNLVCRSERGDKYIEIDVKKHLETFLDRLSRSSFEEFQKFALQNTATLTAARSFCPILEKFKSRITYIDGDRDVSEEYTLRFIDVIASLADFLGEETNFDLVRIIATASRGESPSKILYVLDFLSGETFQAFNELNKVILKESDGFYPLVLKIIKNVNEDIYSQIGAIVLTIMDEANEDRFKALASIWNFWTQEERNFLFRFIDRHLDDETNYVALFEFYADLLSEFPGIVDSITKELSGSEEALEKTYVALEDIISKLRGAEVLADFKKFFSRDQIIRTIEVISRGVLIDTPDLAAFRVDYVDDYVVQARTVPFDFRWQNTGVPVESIVQCIKEMSDPEENFYSLIRDLPVPCRRSKNHEITIRMFTWLDKIDKEYHSTNTRGNESKGLFDELGILSPAMMGTGVTLMKFIQDEFGGAKDGFDYLVGKSKKYLFDLKIEIIGKKGFIHQIEDMLQQWNRFNALTENSGRLHRSFIIKEFALETEWKNKKKLVSMLTDVMDDYQEWIDSGKPAKVLEIKKETQPAQYKCENYQNLKIGNNPCPDREYVYKGMKNLLELLTRYNGDKRPTGIGQLVRSSIAGQGLRIPYDRDEQTLKRMTLKETMEMMYRLTDKSIEINTRKYPYYPEGVRPNKVEPEDYLQPMTTMERIEVTIRDVRFDMNYLGAHYQNAVARSIDYNKTVKGKGSLFRKCLGLRFCGKFFSRDQYRMAVNAIETYDGLLDANLHFGYADYMKGLLSIVVGSSSKIASKDATVRMRVGTKEVVVPYIQTKKQLKEHNGGILTELAMLSAFSNGGRILRDRVGRTQEDFDIFLNSKGLNLLNEKILEGFEKEGGEKAAIELIKKVLEVKTPEGRHIHQDVVDFLAELSYPDLKFVERTISDMLVVFSYVGIPPWVPKDKSENPEFKRYNDSNYYDLFKNISRMIDLYPSIKSKFPVRKDGSEIKMIDVFKGIASPLRFFREKLEREDSKYYIVLNEFFLGMSKLLFDPEPTKNQIGIDLMLTFFSNPEEIGELLSNVRGLYALLDVMHEGNQKGSFSEMAGNIRKLNKTDKLNFEGLREYINHTTREENCFQGDGISRVCSNNAHYDEFAKLNSYVLIRDMEGKTNLFKAADTLLIEEAENLSKLVKDFSPYLILP